MTRRAVVTRRRPGGHCARSARCHGNDDLIIEVVSASNHDLADLLLDYLSRIEGIRDTRASLIVRICKQSLNWGVRDLDGD